MEGLVLRNFVKDDEEALIEIIADTWHYHEFCSFKIARCLARIFLVSCLCNQSVNQVAILDGRVVGVIMGKKIQGFHAVMRYRLKQWWLIARLLMKKEGRKVSKIFKDVNGIDQILLKECGQSYQGELAFFALDKKCRGLGIGKVLFQKMVERLKETGVENFYLFTDTSCNFGFYEHQGMKRRISRKSGFEVAGVKSEMEFYIYDYGIEGR